jgi:peptidyl-prolyl cis-trans isomerase B (cyclophilin B)
MASKPKQALIRLLCILCVGAFSCAEKDELVIFNTDKGQMIAVLYEDTPEHKKNFLKLAKSGSYDSILFHRVIDQFMIQSGDLSTGKSAQAVDYRLSAEFLPDKYIHEKGTLAAARLGDAANPLKESSGSQFYIVHGQQFDAQALVQRAERREYLKLYGLFERMLKSKRFPELTEKYNYHMGLYEQDSTYDIVEAQRKLIYQSLPIIEKQFGDQSDPGFPDWAKVIYATVGGAPHLDGEYTIFGKVIEGLEVIDAIAEVPTDAADRPIEAIRLSVDVIELPKSVIEEKYRFKYK